MYISQKASIHPKAYIARDAVIIGPSIVGARSYIDKAVIVGYPTIASLRKVLGLVKNEGVEEAYAVFDTVSQGSKIGSNVILRYGTIIYERSIIEDYVETGHYVLIRENCIVRKGTRIGSYSVLDAGVTIGENTNIQSCVYIPLGVKIGNNVFIGPCAVFTNDKYPPSKRLIETIIEDNVVIGANATIIAGIKIREGAVIAAGAVVTKDVKPNTVVAGVPAKPIGTRKDYEKKKRIYEKNINPKIV